MDLRIDGEFWGLAQKDLLRDPEHPRAKPISNPSQHPSPSLGIGSSDAHSPGGEARTHT
jgi:hypothetical protein